MGALVSMMGVWPGQKDIPKWLNSMVLRYSGLNKSQIAFISDVHSIVQNNIQFAPKTSNTTLVREIKKMADTMKATFESVVKLLEENLSARQRFQEQFRSWAASRKWNIRRLRVIADRIDAQKKESQSTKIGGSFLSMAGGVLCLATGGAAVPLVLGSAMMGLGSLTSTVEPFAENAALKENIDKVNEIIEREQRCTEELIAFMKPIKDAKFLKGAINSIKDVNCNRDLAPAAEKIKNIYCKNLSRRQKEKEIQRILKSIGLPEELREAISDIIGILVTMYMLLYNCGPLFNVALKSCKFVSDLRNIAVYRAACVGINSVAAIKNGCKLKAAQKWMIRGGIIFDVFNIVHLSSQDPTSSEAKEIRKVADQLETEARKLNRLYQEIQVSQLCDSDSY